MSWLITIILLLNLLALGFIIYTLINIAQIIQENKEELKKQTKEFREYVTTDINDEKELWKNLGKILNQMNS